MVLNQIIIRGQAVMTLVGLAIAANANIVISNLPGNDGTQSASLSSTRVKGMAFTTDSGLWTLDSAVLRLNTNANAGPLLKLHADNAGVPGAALGTFTNPGGFTTGIQNYTFTLGMAVNPSTKYWLVLSQPNNSTPFDWKASSPAQTPTGLWTHAGSVFSTNGGTTWSSSSILTTYEINASLVPEPASIIALSAAFAALAARRRKNR